MGSVGKLLAGGLLAGAMVVAVAAMATADDRHVGYYYPKPDQQEIFTSRAKQLPGAGRTTRIGFVTGLTAKQADQPYPAQTAIFAKGDEAQKLIIISLVDGRMNTLYRARAVLALLTAMARTTEVFQKYRVETVFYLSRLVQDARLHATDDQRWCLLRASIQDPIIFSYQTAMRGRMAVCIAFKSHAGFSSHRLGRARWIINGALAPPRCVIIGSWAQPMSSVMPEMVSKASKIVRNCASSTRR